MAHDPEALPVQPVLDHCLDLRLPARIGRPHHGGCRTVRCVAPAIPVSIAPKLRVIVGHDVLRPLGLDRSTGNVYDPKVSSRSSVVSNEGRFPKESFNDLLRCRHGLTTARIYSMAALYSYIGLSGETVTLADTSINFRGAWSGSTSYAVRDAASYNSRWFIAITAHTGVTPPNVFVIETPTYWSPLVLVEGDPEIADTGSEIAANNAYAQSQLAIQTAWAGTDTANAALALAAQGTAAAAAAQSQADAAWAYAGQAWTIAVNGTQAAAAAQGSADGAQGTADESLSVATLALNTSWAGTQAASSAQTSADSAYALATLALNTAWAGTDAASAAQVAADNANAILAFGVSGTTFTSSMAGSPADTQVIVENGVVTRIATL